MFYQGTLASLPIAVSKYSTKGSLGGKKVLDLKLESKVSNDRESPVAGT